MSLAADRRRKSKALEEAGAALSVKLHARSTRGQRISELQGEDAEADETFWGQGAWQEEEDGDSEFSSEEEEPDKFDKDFNDSESEEDDNDQEETALRKNERAVKRKRPAGGVYKEPKRFVPAKRKAAAPAGGSSHPEYGAGGNAGGGGGGSDGAGRVHGAPISRSVRASTKNKTEKSLEVREGEAKAREAQLKRSVPQPKTPKGQFTQKQLLLEAIQTEQENMRWILKQQRLEDEAKEDEGRPKQHKALASRYHSRRGYVDTIFFPDAYYLPPVLCQLPITADPKAEGGGAGSGRPADRRCKITDAPASYKDPLTGYYYADAAAFKELRKRYGASARRLVKAQKQEQEAKEAASRGGAAAGGAAATGGRVESDAAVAAVGIGSAAGAGAAGAGAATAGGAGGGGGGSSKGAGAAHQSGGQGSGQGKKQGSAKETEKKGKSSTSKGKGKTKGAAKAAAAAAAAAAATAATAAAAAAAATVAAAASVAAAATAARCESSSPTPSAVATAARSESSSPTPSAAPTAARSESSSPIPAARATAERSDSSSPTPATSGGEGAVPPPRQEKAKAGTKRARKQGAAAKGARPAKRPFFAPAPAASAPANPVAAGFDAQLVPLKGHPTTHRGDASADQRAVPLSAGMAVEAAYATTGGYLAQVHTAAQPAPMAGVTAAAGGVGGSDPSLTAFLDAAPPPTSMAAQTHHATPMALASTKAPVAPPGVTGPAGLAQSVPWHEQAIAQGAHEDLNGWAPDPNSAAQKCVGWQQPSLVAAVPEQPPGQGRGVDYG